MRLLLIKTSSLGDILHTFPALTDAKQYFPDLKVDWVVEESFEEIPTLHSAVNKTIPISLRAWRKTWWQKNTWNAFNKFIRLLRQENYDVVIDAQGLVKSAWLTKLTKGPSHGLDWASAREALASLFYQHKIKVNFAQHAITRMREIFAKALDYPIPTNAPIGLNKNDFIKPTQFAHQAYLVCLHGTTWPNKHWPRSYWQDLIRRLAKKELTILLPWHSEAEYEEALAMQQNLSHVHILPRLTLKELTPYLAHAQGVIAVDSGLGHLTASLGTPSISLYGPTDPALTGTVGPNQWHLKADFPCAPCLQRICHYKGSIKKPFPACFSTISPDKILDELIKHNIITDD